MLRLRHGILVLLSSALLTACAYGPQHPSLNSASGKFDEASKADEMTARSPPRPAPPAAAASPPDIAYGSAVLGSIVALAFRHHHRHPASKPSVVQAAAEDIIVTARRRVEPGLRQDRDARLAGLVAEQRRHEQIEIGWHDLRWGGETPVVLTIASANLEEAKREAQAAGGQVEAGAADLAMRVRAELVGADVTVRNPDKLEYDVTDFANVSWTWFVKPNKPGRTHITIRIYDQIKDGDAVVELRRPAYEHDVLVKMGWMQWASWWLEQTGPVRVFGWAMLAAMGASGVWLLRFLGLWRHVLRWFAVRRAAVRQVLNPDAP